MTPKHVYVIGEERFNIEKLRRIRRADETEFHGLFRFNQVQAEGSYPLPDLYHKATDHLDGKRFDGIIGYWDFPVTSLQSLLCRRYRVPGPSVEAMLKCEHKYWSRIEQRKWVPEHAPSFQTFDPFDEASIAALELPYPYWVKPIKSHSSQLGFKIRSARDLKAAVSTIRAQIQRFAEPFQFILDRADLPPEIAHVNGQYCLAEGIIGGKQCTAEGYVHRGEARLFAIIDSIRHSNRSSFSRYQYPSRLPRQVQRRIADLCKRLMEHLGYDDGTFNIELFWDARRDHLWILEVNPRLSQSHSDITEKVDGTANLEKMVDVALGHHPDDARREGPYRCAAKFFVRSFRDALVCEVPSDAQVARIERANPGVHVQMVAQPGRLLSELQNQDSYSYELAVLHIGANDDRELLAKYESAQRDLRFDLQPAHMRDGRGARREQRAIHSPERERASEHSRWAQPLAGSEMGW